MKNFIYLTLFPKYFHDYFSFFIMKKALEKKIISYNVYNLRNFAIKGKVDDYIYGGGKGMLLKIEPLTRAIATIQELYYKSYLILLTPQGKRFNQKDILRILNKSSNLIFICGRYEGFDARINNFIDEQLSIGDFITMGGEIPALVITESLIRAIPKFIQVESFQKESFMEKKNKFDFDSYTRPSNYENLKVPDSLLSGNHKEIEI